MAVKIVPQDWMNGMLAEFIRLTPRCEEIWTGTLEMVSRMTEWMALLTLLVTSIKSLALMESMVALLDLFTVLLVSLASMVASGASLVWWRLKTEQRADGKRGDGLTQKICDKRADELPHKMGEEGADELIHKSDGERAERRG